MGECTINNIVVSCVTDSYCGCYRHEIFQNILSMIIINIISQTNNENMQSTGAPTPNMLKGPLFLNYATVKDASMKKTYYVDILTYMKFNLSFHCNVK